MMRHPLFISALATALLATVAPMSHAQGQPFKIGLILPMTGQQASTGKQEEAAVIFESPRGQILIDAQTRDVVQDVYIRKVEKQNGQLYNVEFDVQKAVKDPGKAK